MGVLKPKLDHPTLPPQRRRGPGKLHAGQVPRHGPHHQHPAQLPAVRPHPAPAPGPGGPWGRERRGRGPRRAVERAGQEEASRGPAQTLPQDAGINGTLSRRWIR
jgi:hypothetical protein